MMSGGISCRRDSWCGQENGLWGMIKVVEKKIRVQTDACLHR